ncbi:MAG: AI-2E family transporter [Puniceicoccaceae bacterium]|nr:MAG: AI-2E family transporter [Puniceicoccaceae bacterium]
MLAFLKEWFNRRFSDPQVIILSLLLIIVAGFVLLLGRTLAPLIAAVILAYLLEGLVAPLERRGVNRTLAVIFVFTLFMAVFVFILLALLPLVYRQAIQLIQDLPGMIVEGQQWLLLLPERFPQHITEEQINDFMRLLRDRTGLLGQQLVARSLALLSTLGTLIIYLVLTPFMIFFLLKDKRAILGWFISYLPAERTLANQVWTRTNVQIANYIRGKFWEILIVGTVTYAAFFFLRLDYALLLAVFVGLSVLIPYIGAIVMTFPIALIALFQWGPGPELAYVLIAYAVIQALDANVLFPLLFSKAVNLHPVAIIVAILFFGAFWGFWGVFFAVPLATCIQAVLQAWPRNLEASLARITAEASGASAPPDTDTLGSSAMSEGEAESKP